MARQGQAKSSTGTTFPIPASLCTEEASFPWTLVPATASLLPSRPKDSSLAPSLPSRLLRGGDVIRQVEVGCLHGSDLLQLLRVCPVGQKEEGSFCQGATPQNLVSPSVEGTGPTTGDGVGLLGLSLGFSRALLSASGMLQAERRAPLGVRTSN